MKKIILSLVALFGAITVNAQTSDAVTATLQTGDNTKVYYGITAFQQAYNDAETGSIITLSPGEFSYIYSFQKSVKVYGAGYYDDEATGVKRTYVTSGITISGDYLTALSDVYLEGIYFNGDINFSTPDEPFRNIKIVKCSFNAMSIKNCEQMVIRQCWVRDQIKGNSGTATNFRIENSSIYFYLTGFVNTSLVSVKNCLFVTASNYMVNYGPYYYENCIFPAGRDVATGAVLVNCYGRILNIYKDGNVTNTNCYYNNGVINWADGQTNYEFLKDDKPRTWQLATPESYLGTDGKQIGPAGGDYGWDVIPSTPRITQSTIAGKTVDGKLSISIKAEARPVVE